MKNQITLQIADAVAVRQRVKSLAKRDDDMKARLADCLKMLWNPSRIARDGSDESVFLDLADRFPNFEPVISYWKNAAIASRLTGTIFRPQPVLLDGDPGLGKTYFASEAAKAMQLSFHEITMSTVTGGFLLSGLSTTWSTGAPGEIAKALSMSNVANPIVLIDEIDKVGQSSQKYGPIGPFYPLLEIHSAKRFRDEALEIELDASNIVWVLTCNEISEIPLPILSRVKRFHIERPTEAQMVPIVKSIYRSLSEFDQVCALIESELGEDVIGRLVSLMPREARKVLQEACMNAVVVGRREVLPEDLKIDVVTAVKESRRIGFI